MKNETHDLLYSRPGMYLRLYEKKLDPASFFGNFLRAVFFLHEISFPKYIDFVVANQFFSIHANGCEMLRLNEKFKEISYIFDISNFRQPFFDDSQSLSYLRPIVWFSEYCLLDITVIDRKIRQMFILGSPIKQQSELAVNDEEMGLSFFFTLPTFLSKNVALAIDRFRQVIDICDEHDFKQCSSIYGRPLIFHKHWCEQSKFHYSLRLTPEIMNLEHSF